MSADLIVLKFDSTYGGQSALSAVAALEELNYAWMEDVAIVERHKSGRYSTHTTHGSVTGGFLWGGLAGMLLGLLFPPVGFLALWGLGAGTGALVEKLTKETGLDKDMLRDVHDMLDKDTSALVLIGASGDADQMARAFEPYNPTQVYRRPLNDETVEALRGKLTEHEEQAASEDTTEPTGS